MKRSHLEKVYYKNKSEKRFKTYKKQENFCGRLYKKKGNGYSIILIILLLLAINYSRKRFNHSFQTREITDHELKLFEKDEVLQGDI